MKVRLLLAHFAEVQNQMLFAMGAGWTEIGPGPAPFSICGIIDVGWEEANRRYTLDVVILDVDEQPLMIETPMGVQPFRFQSQFEVGRPPGAPAGRSFALPLAINVQPLPLQPGRGYIVRASIDGAVHDEVNFSVRQQAAPPLRP